MDDDEGQYIGEALLGGLRNKFGDPDRSLCDVKIKVEDEIFHCHKVILAAYSDFFMSMFTLNFQEKNQEVIDVQTVDAESFRMILDFLYGRQTVLKEKDAECLLKAASALQVDCLAGYAQNVLIKHISPDNAFEMLSVANTWSCYGLKFEAIEIIVNDFSYMHQSPDFIQLEEQDLIKIISDKNLRSFSEDEVADAVFSWLAHDENRCKVSAANVLEYVHLPLLPSDHLIDLTDKYSFLETNLECAKIVKEAMRYHMQPGRRHEMNSRRTRFRYYDEFQNVLYIFYRKNPLVYSFSDGKERPIPVIQGKHFGVCSYGNSIYVAGGTGTPKRFEEYLILHRAWITHADIPYAYNSQPNMAAVGNEIYLIGGSHNIYKYNLTSHVWKYGGRLNIKVHQASAAVQGHCILVFGGYQDNKTLERSVQCFDTKTHMCTILPHQGPKSVTKATVSDETVYLVDHRGKIMTFGMDVGITEIGRFLDFTFKRWCVCINEDILYVLNAYKEKGEVRRWDLKQKQELGELKLKGNVGNIDGVVKSIAPKSNLNRTFQYDNSASDSETDVDIDVVEDT